MAAQDDVKAVLRSQDYYRLKQPVVSPGDIFELDVSTKAIYIGPDSDIAEIQVTYFNPDEPNALETAVVAVNGPFVGRLDSSMVTKVPTTGQPGRILVNPVDIVNNQYAWANSVAMRRFNIPPVIDVIAALTQLPDIPAIRADRTLRLPSVPYTLNRTAPPDDGSTDILIPIYGRRMITIAATAMFDVKVECSLVNLQPGGANVVPRTVCQIVIPSTIPASLYTAAAVIRASDAARQGYTTDLAGVITNNYFDSDQSQSPFFPATPAPFPTARGMADLLMINVKDVSGLPLDQTNYIDLFIKMSDRED